MQVEELLQKENIPFIQKGNDYIVSCLNPDHPDRNPSMRVDRISGVFHCFSCGYKGNLFTLHGEETSILQQLRDKVKRSIVKKTAETVGLSMPSSAIPYRGDWRNISKETYAHFRAFNSHEKDFVGRVVFPIYDLAGNIRAFIGRHTGTDPKKYLITPSKVKLPIYPCPEPVQGSIILVEGIFDAINLWDKGIYNAACIFGTNNVNEDKLELIRMRGAQKVYVFMDGDEAGQKAADKIKRMCENIYLPSTNILMRDTDPGALSAKQVQKLKEQLYS